MRTSARLRSAAKIAFAATSTFVEEEKITLRVADFHQSSGRVPRETATRATVAALYPMRDAPPRISGEPARAELVWRDQERRRAPGALSLSPLLVRKKYQCASLACSLVLLQASLDRHFRKIAFLPGSFLSSALCTLLKPKQSSFPCFISTSAFQHSDPTGAPSTYEADSSCLEKISSSSDSATERERERERESPPPATRPTRGRHRRRGESAATRFDSIC